MDRLSGWQPVVAAWAFVGVALLRGGLASAELSEEADTAAHARELYLEGVAFADERQWQQAAESFRAALALRSSPAASFNLATALGQLGELVEALEILDALEADTSTPEAVRAAAQSLRPSLEARVGALTVTLTGEDEGASVELDGAPLPGDRLGVPIRVDPGSHVVRVLRGETLLSEHELRIEAGSTAAVSADVPAAPSPRDAAIAAVTPEVEPPGEVVTVEPPPPTGGAWLVRQWWFWTAIGVVVAGGVTTAAVLAAEQPPEPVVGDFDPGLIEIGR